MYAFADPVKQFARHMQVQQMQALVARTQAAKQDAQQTQVQLDASTELLDKKVQEVISLRVSFCAARAHIAACMPSASSICEPCSCVACM